MNETRRKPTTGIFYIPNHTDTAGHTKPFDYLVINHWGKVKVLWHEADSNYRPSVHSRTRQPPDHDHRIKYHRIKYIPGPLGGIFSIANRGIVCDNNPATCRPSPGCMNILIIYKIYIIILINYIIQLNYIIYIYYI